MKKRLAANSMLVITAMIWGFAFVAQKEASAYIGSLTFNGIRFLLGALSLLPVIIIFERSDIKDKAKLKKTIKYGAVTGSILFAASTLQQLGVSINEQASKAGFITGLYTVLVPLFGIFVGKNGISATFSQTAHKINPYLFIFEFPVQVEGFPVIHAHTLPFFIKRRKRVCFYASFLSCNFRVYKKTFCVKRPAHLLEQL